MSSTKLTLWLRHATTGTAALPGAITTIPDEVMPDEVPITYLLELYVREH